MTDQVVTPLQITHLSLITKTLLVPDVCVILTFWLQSKAWPVLQTIQLRLKWCPSQRQFETSFAFARVQTCISHMSSSTALQHIYPQKRKLLQHLVAAKQIFSAQMIPNIQVKNMNSWTNPFCWDHCSGALEAIAATSAAVQHKPLQSHHKDNLPGGPSAAPVPCHPPQPVPFTLLLQHPICWAHTAQSVSWHHCMPEQRCAASSGWARHCNSLASLLMGRSWPRTKREWFSSNDSITSAWCSSHFKNLPPPKGIPLLPKGTAETWNQRQSTHYSNVVRKFYSETWYKFVTQHWVHDSDAGAYAVTTETQECFGQLL